MTEEQKLQSEMKLRTTMRVTRDVLLPEILVCGENKCVTENQLHSEPNSVWLM